MSLLKPALQAVVRMLDHHAIDYALIGGLAVSLRSSQRLTEDVDFIIESDHAQALALLRSASEFNLEPMFDMAAEVLEKSALLPLSECTTGTGIDLALGLTGYDQLVIDRATECWLDEQRVFVATAEDLLLMKVIANRDRDQQDIRMLIEGKQEIIDWEYCLKIADELNEALDADISSRVEELKD